MAWRTTEKANVDLDLMAEAGMLAFGERHARSYLNTIFDMFDTLAAYPDLAAERRSAKGYVRLMPCEAHHILYATEDGDVVILRVLHGLQNWFELL
jgi:toxin ParE1/3/4